MAKQGWDSTTQEAAPSPSARSRGIRTPEGAIVIVWCRSDPSRVGEVARLPADGAPTILGRGDVRADDACARVRFFQERMGGLRPGPPLEGASLSRRQLLLHTTGSAVAFKQVGACPVLHNATPRSEGTLRPGDVLRLGSELVLLYVARPRPLDGDARCARFAPHPFGGPDAVGLIGESAAMGQTRAELAFAASAPGHVLVLGESGAGKELVTRAVHALSDRSSGPFVARSAASFPATLVDAELFGTMRNFPNVGMPERPGLIGAAHGGSLFLDEIGELPLDAQSRLLRVLDCGGEFHRLGEAQARRSEFRLLAATNRPVESLRSDVAARFALRIHVPSLRERMEDVPLLARGLLCEARARAPSFLARFFDARGEPRLGAQLIECLVRHEYQTNVRELNELLVRAMRDSPGDVLENEGDRRSARPVPRRDDGPPAEARIREVLASHGGSAASAAIELGLPSRYALYRLMKRYQIPKTERLR